MHLVQFITDTMELGLEVTLCVDVNEHMIKSKIALQFQKLGLAEAYDCKFKYAGPTSYFRGRH